ncbi:hypothetical protein [Fusobacterium mortiferum]|uniref:Uncharacterized protein n=1 Tax=Fusobacterium mortiferum ATCC 9817 TaxID=469616 RepID=A0ABM6TXA4_FUSMR|nr:hypothetical protein [Fusobacterium mortiferum]AVQ18884.1 hypothetical protein C4N19_07165 [Fusobacterium mortiferum ATCC 9817]EEO35130.1 hypothetical protein FMAG_00692 [Fusobacterium mortiferum ATCC 9817]MDY2800381.1 hypothetical protein [Fusobacterium mortiferum]
MKKNRNKNRELLILDRTKKIVLKNSISFLNEVKEDKRKFYNRKNIETFWDFQIAVAKCLIIYKKRIIKYKYSCISKKRIKKQKGIKLKNNYYSTQAKLTSFYISRVMNFINQNSQGVYYE